MVSYIKTQWFRVLIGFVALGLCIYYLFQPGADKSTLEGLNQNLRNSFAALCFFLTSMIWFISSIVEYHGDCIKLLEKKQERDDAMYELVQELVAANMIDREIMKKYEGRLKKLEAKGNIHKKRRNSL